MSLNRAILISCSASSFSGRGQERAKRTRPAGPEDPVSGFHGPARKKAVARITAAERGHVLGDVSSGNSTDHQCLIEDYFLPGIFFLRPPPVVAAGNTISKDYPSYSR